MQQCNIAGSGDDLVANSKQTLMVKGKRKYLKCSHKSYYLNTAMGMGAVRQFHASQFSILEPGQQSKPCILTVGNRRQNKCKNPFHICCASTK